MPRPTVLTLLLLAALHPTLRAQTQTPDAPLPPRLTHQWQRIANLPPGTPILVEERTRPIPTQCALLWIDANALACTTGSNRIIFPATSLISVQPAFQRDRPHIPGPIIATTIGAILGGIAGSHQGVGAGFAGAGIGALLFGSIAISIPPPNPTPRPQWFVRIPVGRRRFP